MHELLASQQETYRPSYEPPVVRYDSIYLKSDLWRAIPPEKQQLLSRKGNLSEVKPIATDGTHFLSIDVDGNEHIGHVTNLILPEKNLFLFLNKEKKMKKEPKERKVKTSKALVNIDLESLFA